MVGLNTTSLNAQAEIARENILELHELLDRKASNRNFRGYTDIGAGSHIQNLTCSPTMMDSQDPAHILGKYRHIMGLQKKIGFYTTLAQSSMELPPHENIAVLSGIIQGFIGGLHEGGSALIQIPQMVTDAQIGIETNGEGLKVENMQRASDYLTRSVKERIKSNLRY